MRASSVAPCRRPPTICSMLTDWFMHSAGAAASIKTAAIEQVQKTIDPTPSVQLLAWGNAEAAICIMAASMPILRALFRGSLRQAVPMGYETGAYASQMAEPSMASRRSIVTGQTRTLSCHESVAARVPDQRNTEPSGVGAGAGGPDRVPTLQRSAEIELPGASYHDDWSDGDSMEMTDYQHRQDPVDFVRRDPM